MLEFKKIELSDVPLLRPYFEKCTNRFCDFSVGGSVMWRNVYETEFAVSDGALYMRFRLSDGKWAFSYPLGAAFGDTVKKLLEYCEKADEKLIFAAVSEEEKKEMESLFPYACTFADRDHADYIYLGEDLAGFKGKKYATQRNHINRFLSENPDWHFEMIRKEDIPAVNAYFAKYAAFSAKDSFSALEERKCVLDVFENFDAYGFFGEALYVGTDIVGFFLCEAVADTLMVHIEKCDRSVTGAYQMLVKREAEKYCTGKLIYVNREDDAGDEGLRRSKLAYRPLYLAEKYTVTIE
ncbi:MAG: DUF2156 domain-containing protein [Ruminococcaceae bacterium]|nr:DUF2156 domain-containing protein [Oscillospiraceae bacterium]